jgi:hypothetical protein
VIPQAKIDPGFMRLRSSEKDRRCFPFDLAPE